MESVLNRIRDTVSSTVYSVTTNLSTALPGNPLTREYDLIRHVSSAGPQLCLKIYDAIKKSTREEAALFVLDKKALDQKLSKKDREMILETIRKGINQLTRLRHPSLLTVQHNLEESRDSIAFATEPVIASLANLLGNRDNSPNSIDEDIDKFEFFDVEIKYGLLKVSEGLAFLHNDVKLLHRNIAPENIIVNRNGVWKIAGFDFCAQTSNPNEIPLKFPTLNLINYSDIPPICQPNPDYIAPEYLDRDVTSVETSADMWSLGALTFTLYNKGKPLLSSAGNLNVKRIEQLKRLKESSLTCIPNDSRNHIKMLLSVDTRLRPDAIQFSKLQFFEDVLVKTLQYLDALYQWDNLQKSQFYKGLPEVLSQMPKRVKLHRVVSSLAKEHVNPDMVPFVLPNILLIAKETDDKEFQKWIVPDLVGVFKMKEPIQIGIILMQNMDFLVSKFKSNPESLREHILPLIYRSLDSEAQQIQELCLSVIPSMVHLIDYTATKNSLLPRLKTIALNTKLLSVRVNCLICLGKILEHLDKWLVLDEVLPVLPEIPSREPAVIMASIAIYRLTMNSNKLGLTKEVMATKVIPFLVPLSIENGLSLQQFQTITSLIREMMSKVEEEQQIKLEQLNSIKAQQQTLFNSTRTSPSFDSLSSLANTANTSTAPVVTNNSISYGLSLEDKERLAKQNEQSERLKAQSPLTPQTVRPTADKPKDLTSTLINSSLTNLSMNSRQIPSNAPIMNQMNQPFTSPQPFNAFQYPSPPMQNNVIQPSMTGFASMSAPQQQPIRPNMSAFDSIMIPDLKASASPQMPMRSMNTSINSMTNMSPLLSSNAFNQQNSQSFGAFVGSNAKPSQAKQLSKSELEDFLS